MKTERKSVYWSSRAAESSAAHGVKVKGGTVKWRIWEGKGREEEEEGVRGAASTAAAAAAGVVMEKEEVRQL